MPEIFDRQCAIIDCTELRAVFQGAPLCVPHMVEAWRWVEARPNLRPSSAPTAVVSALTWDGPAPPIRRQGRHPGVVYYLARPNGRVKIGTTKNLHARLVALAATWDDVLAIEWGGHPRETERHGEFAADRVFDAGRRTEEFRPSDRLAALIAQLREAHGDPHAAYERQTA